MKAVPKVDSNGLFIEDIIVDDSFSGVVPFYFQTSKWINLDIELKDSEITGYTIGYSIPAGLYKPRFDLAAWKSYQEAVGAAHDEYHYAYAEWFTLPEEERGEAPVYTQPEEPVFWIEGLSPEEITELTAAPKQKLSETEQLKQRIADLEVALAQLMADK